MMGLRVGLLGSDQNGAWSSTSISLMVHSCAAACGAVCGCLYALKAYVCEELEASSRVTVGGVRRPARP